MYRKIRLLKTIIAIIIFVSLCFVLVGCGVNNMNPSVSEGIESESEVSPDEVQETALDDTQKSNANLDERDVLNDARPSDDKSLSTLPDAKMELDDFSQYAIDPDDTIPSAEDSNSPIAPKTSETTPTMQKAIVFHTPELEIRVRDVLNKHGGIITDQDVLAITELYLNSGELRSFAELTPFRNLISLRIDFSNISSLEGIDALANLESLQLGRNNIKDISLLAGLTSLKELDLSENDITDFSPLENLINLESLVIGNNGSYYTDLSPIKKLVNLKSFNAINCGISDISVLSNMTNLTYLNLWRNDISDISVLISLSNLTYLELGMNNVSDISPLEGLKSLEYTGLHGNPIPEDSLEEYYRPNIEDCFITKFEVNINDSVPELIIEALAFFDKRFNGYSVETLTISEASTGIIMQEIKIPKYYSSESPDTTVPIEQSDTMGLLFEDYNFDGYVDMSLWKHQGGTSTNEPRFYWLFDIDTMQFVSNSQLEDISYSSWIGIDNELKQISGNSRNRDGYVIWYYEFRADEYVHVKTKTMTVDERTGDSIIWHTVISELIDGEMVVTEDYYEDSRSY